MGDTLNIEVIKDRFCDYSTERSVLALAYKYEDLFYTLISKVTVDDFLAEDTNKLYFVMRLAYESGIRVFDPPILAKIAEDIGVSSLITERFLLAISNLVVSKDNFINYLDTLLDISTKYKLYLNLYANSELVYQNANSIESVTSNDLLSKVQSDILDLSLVSKAVEEPIHIAEGLEEYIASIEDTKVEIIGLSTGYPVLDKAIDGLINGTLTIVAARKKMGKSTFLTNIGTNVAVKAGEPVLYVDTEMSFNEWRARVLAIISGVPERVIKHGGFKQDKQVYERVKRSVALLQKSKLYHYYLPGYTVEKLAALYRKYKLKEDISLGIFDYVKEPDLSSVDKGRKEYQILGDVTTKLKDLAGQLDIPFLAAVQLNRAGDVADSDRVARYGDVIAFWGLRDSKQAEENAWDLDEIGHYGLYIKDSRRGGTTGAAGIGYHFFHSKLTIREVPIINQVEKHLYAGEETLSVKEETSTPGGLMDADNEEELI